MGTYLKMKINRQNDVSFIQVKKKCYLIPVVSPLKPETSSLAGILFPHGKKSAMNFMLARIPVLDKSISSSQVLI